MTAKRITHVILLVFILILSIPEFSCKKADKLTHFNMDYSTTFEIKSVIGINLPFNIFSPSIKTNSESTFEVNDTRKDLVEQIKPTSLKLTIQSPTDHTFNFLKSIHLFVSAVGLPEKEIAFATDLKDDDATELILDVISEDLQAYIKSDQMSIRAETVTDQIITTKYVIKADMVFWVDARILGI